MLIQFENIEKKFENAVRSEDYSKLVEKVKKAERVYVIGNGGLHFVASHMATDMSRLIDNKSVYSFTSFVVNYFSIFNISEVRIIIKIIIKYYFFLFTF